MSNRTAAMTRVFLRPRFSINGYPPRAPKKAPAWNTEMMSAFAGESLLRLKSRWNAGSFSAVPMKLRGAESQYDHSETRAKNAPGAVTEQRGTKSDNDACTVYPQVVDFGRRRSVLDNLEAHAGAFEPACGRVGGGRERRGKEGWGCSGPAESGECGEERVCGVLRALVQALDVRQARETAVRRS